MFTGSQNLNHRVYTDLIIRNWVIAGSNISSVLCFHYWNLEKVLNHIFQMLTDLMIPCFKV